MTLTPGAVLGWPLLLGLSPALITYGFFLLASAGATVSFLFLLGACRRFLQFRLGSHSLPIATGRFAGGHHLARSGRVCSHCDGVSVADELHMVFECPALALIREKYAGLFTPATDNMRSFFGQDAHVQVFKFILDCLDFLEV